MERRVGESPPTLHRNRQNQVTTVSGVEMEKLAHKEKGMVRAYRFQDAG
eukprot:CAMPEP_0114540394 /NCGR_PEP_ID=MMETSP0114-20121206/742_1 /TAXON_ID=31324 /ORGANISM="Goniomonas sp, Strain m" /LENGTH=48 /DNA_ID= /DNA_START= /DNA_END= /DNA_ORIENTATION=